MVYVPHLRVTMSGRLGTNAEGAEEWSTGFALVLPPGEAVDLLPTTEFNTIRDLLAGWISSANACISNAVFLTEVQCAAIGADGRYIRTPEGGYLRQQHFFGEAAPRGARTSNRHPYQVAYVVSLRTLRAGAPGKGRMYMPCPAGEVDIFGHISTADRDAMLTAARGTLAAVRSTVQPEFQVAVVSSKGVWSPVTAVRVGRVLDTHRSRRGDLAEEYAQQAL